MGTIEGRRPPRHRTRAPEKAFCSHVASRQTWRSQARFEAHLGRFARGRPTFVAEGRDRPALPRRRGDGAADRGQGHQRLRPGALQARRRCAGRAHGPGRGRAGGPDPGLWRGPRPGPGVRRIARRHLRAGLAARHPQHRAGGVPPSACAVAALPSRAPDRRAEPRHRARHQRHGVPDPLHHLQHPADPVRDLPGRRGAVEPLRLALLGGDAGRRRRLHRLLGRAVGMAHQVRAPHERRRHRGQRQGDRQPAELRDGEVLRQRGARGAPLRRRPPPLREGRHPLQPHAVAAQCRAGRHHLRRPGRGHGHGGLRREGRHHDAGRLRGGQRLPDPALHALEHAGLRLSRDQECARQHGEHVRPDGRQDRDRRQAGRAGLEGGGRRDRVRPCRLPLREGAADPARCQLPRGAGRHGGDRGLERRRQVDGLAHPVPLLRRRRRAASGSTARTSAT